MIFQYSKSDKIDYAVVGNGENNLLLIHGFGASNLSWDYIVKFFDKEKYTLYLVNLLGHGYSSYNYDSDYSIESQAKIIKALIEFLKINDLAIIGHSYGGSISLLLMILYDEHIKVTKLVLIDVGAFPDKIPFFVRFLRNPFQEFLISTLVPKNLKAYYTLKKLYFKRELINRERVERYSKFYRYKQWKAIVKAAKKIVPTNYEDIIKRYKLIKIPLLIIWGKNDDAITLETGEKLCEVISNCSLIVINDCGHIPHEEKPQETFNTINEFLK